MTDRMTGRMTGDRITLTGITGFGHHGVLAAERELGQVFVADVTLYLDLVPAGVGDDLSRTVDYGQLTQRIHEAIVLEPVNLIETLAERIATICLGEHRVDRVTVTVHKPQAPIPVTLSDVAVTIERSRA